MCRCRVAPAPAPSAFTTPPALAAAPPLNASAGMPMPSVSCLEASAASYALGFRLSRRHKSHTASHPQCAGPTHSKEPKTCNCGEQVHRCHRQCRTRWTSSRSHRMCPFKIGTAQPARTRPLRARRRPHPSQRLQLAALQLKAVPLSCQVPPRVVLDTSNVTVCWLSDGIAAAAPITVAAAERGRIAVSGNLSCQVL